MSESVVHNPKALRRRRTIRQMAERIVRVFSVSALLGSGFVGAAESLSGIDSLDDDEKLGHARALVAQARDAVLTSPPADGDRALLALVAANEALAVAAVVSPSEQHLQDILVAAWVAEEAANG